MDQRQEKQGMWIFRLSGGLGNQFFSFAAAYHICREKNRVFGLDVSTQCADWFFRDFDLSHYDIHYDKKICYRLGDDRIDHLLLNHVCRRAALGLLTPTVKERKRRTYDPEVFDVPYRNAYFVGDWQSYKYFQDSEADIRRMFVYQDAFSKGAEAIKERIAGTPQSVGVHFRRGDYVNLNITIDPKYYHDAIVMAAQKLDDPVFFCFSEDLEWVKQNVSDLPYHFEFIEYESDQKGLEDFELLRSCRNIITCNSTYSWWAAWLNEEKDRLVIHPEMENWQGDDFWPAEWEKIVL